MLLAEYLEAEGIASAEDRRLKLTDIDRFLFGDHYAICLRAGKTITVPSLEVALGIMESEFLRAPAVSPVMQLDTGLALKKAVISLAVTPSTSTFLPGVALHSAIQHIRMSVADYSLTGNWGYFRKGTL